MQPAVFYREPGRARAQIWTNSAIFVLSGPLQIVFQGPGPRFGQTRLFLQPAVLYREPGRARAQIWPNSAICVLSCPLQRSWKGPGPDLAKFGYFCIKLSFTEGPGPSFGKTRIFLTEPRACPRARGLNLEPLQGANGLNPKPRPSQEARPEP